MSTILRSFFGTWGREVSDEEFARALAMLGALAARGRVDEANVSRVLKELEKTPLAPLKWRLPLRAIERLSSRGLSARSLADRWANSGLEGAARIEVQPAATERVEPDVPTMLAWSMSQISRPVVGAQSVYLRADEPRAGVGWEWPIRVGFLDDPASRNLRERLVQVIDRRGWQNLVDFTEQHGTRGVDLLLIPADVRESLSLVAGLAEPVRADCTIVLGDATGQATSWMRLVGGIRGAARTAGVAVANVSPGETEDWFAGLIANLSHNQPVDVALFSANRERNLAAPFLAISRPLAEFSRISAQLRRAAKKMREPGFSEMFIKVDPGDPIDRSLSVGAGTLSFEKLSRSIERVAAKAEREPAAGEFSSEGGGATGAAELKRATEAVAAAAPAPATERFIQAQVFDVRKPDKPVQRQNSLRRGAHHRIVVRIGEDDPNWASNPAAPAFPVDSLPKEQDEWTLTVVMSVAQSGDDPQVSQLVLPRLGNSSEASFFLFVPEEWKRVEARIAVLHRNRVIQTAMLTAPVGTDDKRVGRSKLDVRPEVVARARLDNLGLRRRFDAALVLNKSKDGTKRIVAVADDKAARLSPSATLTQAISDIDAIITSVATEPKKYAGKLKSKPVVELLRQLAIQGNLLHDAIVKDGNLASVGLDRGGPIQVISAVADARLPIELVYDRRAPNDDAELCPKAAESLRNGKCEGKCVAEGREAEFICPLAFWGLNRVIERHRHGDIANEAPAQGFAFTSEPSDRRDAIDILASGIVGGTEVVDKSVKGGLEEICELVQKATKAKKKLKPVRDWKSWVKEIGATTPSLVVLLVHAEETETPPPRRRMQIGSTWLDVARIEEEHVRTKDGDPPVVLLIGCETGATDRQFGNFINRLRNRGAAIVVATGATIHAMHAVPVAKEFIDSIKDVASGPNAVFGDVMLAVRREMLARGIPMVLTLNAYGDADWRLSRSS